MLERLFVQREKTADLGTLIRGSNLLILPEVEPVFCAMGLLSALCNVYSKKLDMTQGCSTYTGSFLLASLHAIGFSRFESQTCRGRVGGCRNFRPPVGYVRATHETA